MAKIKTKGNNHAPSMSAKSLMDVKSVNDLQEGMGSLFEKETIEEIVHIPSKGGRDIVPEELRRFLMLLKVNR